MSFDPKNLTPEQKSLAAEVLVAVGAVLDATAGKTAGTILTVLKTMVGAFLSSHSGDITHDQVRADLQRWLDALGNDDSVIDDKIKSKFDLP